MSITGNTAKSTVLQKEKIFPDRIIPHLPKCYNKEAQIHESDCFDLDVQDVCSSDRIQSIRFKMCKMIVIGDLAVGKTSLVSRFNQELFQHSYKATIGIDFIALRFEVLNSPFTIHIWDTAGQERFQSIAAAYYRGAHIVTIVFDLSDKNSLRSAERWLESARKENKQANKLLVFLVGTKNDLISTQDCKIIESEAIKIAQKMEAEFWNVSAKTGENVKQFFCRVAALAFELSVQRELKRRETYDEETTKKIKIRKAEHRHKMYVAPCCEQ